MKNTKTCCTLALATGTATTTSLGLVSLVRAARTAAAITVLVMTSHALALAPTAAPALVPAAAPTATPTPSTSITARERIEAKVNALNELLAAKNRDTQTPAQSQTLSPAPTQRISELKRKLEQQIKGFEKHPQDPSAPVLVGQWLSPKETDEEMLAQELALENEAFKRIPEKETLINTRISQEMVSATLALKQALGLPQAGSLRCPPGPAAAKCDPTVPLLDRIARRHYQKLRQQLLYAGTFGGSFVTDGVRPVPQVNDLIDACEAITGWLDCDPGKRKLSDPERQMSVSELARGDQKLLKGIAAKIPELKLDALLEMNAQIKDWMPGASKAIFRGDFELPGERKKGFFDFFSGSKKRILIRSGMQTVAAWEEFKKTWEQPRKLPLMKELAVNDRSNSVGIVELPEEVLTPNEYKTALAIGQKAGYTNAIKILFPWNWETKDIAASITQAAERGYEFPLTETGRRQKGSTYRGVEVLVELIENRVVSAQPMISSSPPNVPSR